MQRKRTPSEETIKCRFCEWKPKVTRRLEEKLPVCLFTQGNKEVLYFLLWEHVLIKHPEEYEKIQKFLGE